MKKLSFEQIQGVTGGVLCGPTPVQAAECIVFGCLVPGIFEVLCGVLTLDPENIGFSCPL